MSLRNTVHQTKSFLFAGQDTAATLVQWLCYEMYKNPEVSYRLHEEHDLAFSPGVSAADMLSQPSEADCIPANRLAYTTAVVKETLRLDPPAATARPIPADTEFKVEIDHELVRIDGLRVYPSQWLIHPQPGNPGLNHPSIHARWLDAEYVAQLPPGASMPFEHGPRN